MIKRLLLSILILFLPLSVYAVDYTADANCMGAWFMEDIGNETDQSGEGGTLTETSGTIPLRAARIAGAWARDFEAGDTEYLTHADANSTDISGADQSLSIVASIKWEAEGSLDDLFLTKYNTTGSQRQYRLTIDDSTNEGIEFTISSNGSDFNQAFGGTDLGLDIWYDTAGVYNDTDMRVYLDGSLDSNGADNPKAYTSGINDSTATFNLGAQDGILTSNLFDGIMDDVGVFDRELSSTEIADISANGLDGNGKTLTDYTADANCMGAWGMEAAGGNNETDLSGEGNTMTETGGTIARTTDHKTGSFARDFEAGDTEYFTAGTGTTLDISGVDQTISLVSWFKRESETGTNQYLVSKYNFGDNERCYAIRSSTGEDGAMDLSSDGNQNGTLALGNNNNVQNGVWTHIAGVYNDTDIRIYDDGFLDSNGSSSPFIYTGGINNAGVNAEVTIGAIFNSVTPSNFADGLIDDVAVFDRELFAWEIEDIFLYGMEGNGVSSSPLVELAALPITVAEQAPGVNIDPRLLGVLPITVTIQAPNVDIVTPATTSFQGAAFYGATLYGG